MKHIKLYCKSMGKVFKVGKIALSANEANEYTEKHKDYAVIAEDDNGLIYLADVHSLTIKSGLLPD